MNTTIEKLQTFHKWMHFLKKKKLGKPDITQNACISVSFSVCKYCTTIATNSRTFSSLQKETSHPLSSYYPYSSPSNTFYLYGFVLGMYFFWNLTNSVFNFTTRGRRLLSVSVVCVGMRGREWEVSIHEKLCKVKSCEIVQQNGNVGGYLFF